GNVFALGDVAALPTAKTGAAIRKQAPVVVDNLLKLLDQNPADNQSYDGYSSCPLVTGYGKMVLAEFNYKNEFTPDPLLKFMLVFRSYKEHCRLWMLKKYGLPFLYWNQMLKGKMYRVLCNISSGYRSVEPVTLQYHFKQLLPCLTFLER